MTDASEKALIDTLATAALVTDAVKHPGQRKAIRDAFLDLCGLVIALRRRVEVLERHPLKYAGVWKKDTVYLLGNFVTDAGSLWHCNKPTTTRPGASADWTLACKRGANGKDTR